MKRPSLVFASVASELHVGRAREISRRAFATLNSLEAEVSGSPEPIEEPGELEEALSVDADLKVVFVASGGTSRLLSEALAGLHVFLWAHPEDNSLPSALSAREKMRSSGSWRGELVFSSPDEVPEKLSAELRAISALRELGEAEIIAFCSASRAREIEEALGSILDGLKEDLRPHPPHPRPPIAQDAPEGLLYLPGPAGRAESYDLGLLELPQGVYGPQLG